MLNDNNVLFFAEISQKLVNVNFELCKIIAQVEEAKRLNRIQLSDRLYGVSDILYPLCIELNDKVKAIFTELPKEPQNVVR